MEREITHNCNNQIRKLRMVEESQESVSVRERKDGRMNERKK
jgi:hypothetical protein